MLSARRSAAGIASAPVASVRASAAASNSNLLNWYHLNTQYSVRIPQGSLKYPISFYKGLPIPPISPNNRTLVSELEKRVDQIMAIKKGGPEKDASTLQNEIDELVYRLYELTPDEIRVVKESAPSSSPRAELDSPSS